MDLHAPASTVPGADGTLVSSSKERDLVCIRSRLWKAVSSDLLVNKTPAHINKDMTNKATQSTQKLKYT